MPSSCLSAMHGGAFSVSQPRLSPYSGGGAGCYGLGVTSARAGCSGPMNRGTKPLATPAPALDWFDPSIAHQHPRSSEHVFGRFAGVSLPICCQPVAVTHNHPAISPEPSADPPTAPGRLSGKTIGSTSLACWLGENLDKSFT
jgi:hypothetical protein